MENDVSSFDYSYQTLYVYIRPRRPTTITSIYKVEIEMKIITTGIESLKCAAGIYMKC